MRRALVLVLVGFGTGCLFPSFDDFGGTGKKSGSSSTSSSSSSSTSSSSSSTSSSAGGATGDSGTVKSGILCAGTACAAGSYCCGTIGGPTCQPDGTSEEFCTSIEGGTIFRCGDNGDCENGFLCCLDKNHDVAQCAATCSTQVVCNGPTGACPASQSCTDTVSGFKVCK